MLSATFYTRKYRDFGYAEFLAHYALKIKSSKTCEYHPDEFVKKMKNGLTPQKLNGWFQEEQCYIAKQDKFFNTAIQINFYFSPWKI